MNDAERAAAQAVGEREAEKLTTARRAKNMRTVARMVLREFPKCRDEVEAANLSSRVLSALLDTS